MPQLNQQFNPASTPCLLPAGRPRYAFAMNDVFSTRRANFQALLEQPPLSRLRLKRDKAHALDMSASMFSHLLRPDYRIGHDLARSIEDKVGKPSGWLDHTSRDVRVNESFPLYQSHTVGLDEGTLDDALEVLALLNAMRVGDPVPVNARTVMLVYDYLAQDGQEVTPTNVIDITTAIAARIRGSDGGSTEKAKSA